MAFLSKLSKDPPKPAGDLLNIPFFWRKRPPVSRGNQWRNKTVRPAGTDITLISK